MLLHCCYFLFFFFNSRDSLIIKADLFAPYIIWPLI